MQERIDLLERNLSELKRFFSKYSLDDVEGEKSLEWAMRYGFLESIQALIDIACHLVAARNLGTPESYGDCIRFLERFAYLEKELARRLLGMVGLRNLLVHDYVSIDIKKLYTLSNQLGDFSAFLQAVGSEDYNMGK